MNVSQRIFLIRMVEKMNEYPVFCERIGIRNQSVMRKNKENEKC